MGTKKKPNKHVRGEQARMYKNTSKNSPTMKCDNCGKVFKQNMHQIDFISGKKIEVLGFQCPECKKKYVACVTDNELRKNMNKASDLYTEYNRLNKVRQTEFNDSIKRRGFVLLDIKDRWMKKLSQLHTEYSELIADNKRRGAELKSAYMDKMTSIKEE